MKLPCWTNVALIFNREVRDQFRDRRTLFMIAILPLLLYPLMGVSFLQLAQFLKSNPSHILLVCEENLPANPPLITDGIVKGVEPSEAALLVVDVRQCDLPSMDTAADQATAIIDQGDYDMVVCIPNGFNDFVTSHPFERSADVSVEPLIFYNAAKDKSRIAFDRMSVALSRWHHRLAEEAFEKHNVVRQSTATPFTLAAQDVAQPNGRQIAVWSKILPFVALVWALTGAFYPAVDLCAGEKERGTLETLLCSPAARSEIVIGKLLTIMLFSFATSALNLCCMTVTAGFASSQFHSSATGSSPFELLGAPPLMSLGWLFLALIPIVALFSALSLALATMARSTKEGQYYLMPLLLISMPLMMLAMFPSAELDLGSSIIPITGIMLLLRQFMEGQFADAFLYVVPVTVVTGGCCLMAIRWAIDQFNNETVLFRSSERFSIWLYAKHVFRDRGPIPSVAEGILCGILILLIRFFASLSMSAPSNWNQLALMTAATLIAFVATPAILMAVMLTSDPKKTLMLTRPVVWASVPAAALLAVCLHPIAIALTVLVRTMYPIDAAAFAPFEAIIQSAPNFLSIVLLMAVLPAICEEIAFRGFILSGMRQTGRPWRAIILTSVLFGIAHGVVQQSMLAMIFGLVLGYIAIRSESILPCIVFHALHNTLSLCFNQYAPSLLQKSHSFDKLIQTLPDGTHYYSPPVVLGAFILCAGLLRWFQACGGSEVWPAESTLVDLDHSQHRPAVVS